MRAFDLKTSVAFLALQGAIPTMGNPACSPGRDLASQERSEERGISTRSAPMSLITLVRAIRDYLKGENAYVSLNWIGTCNSLVLPLPGLICCVRNTRIHLYPTSVISSFKPPTAVIAKHVCFAARPTTIIIAMVPKSSRDQALDGMFAI